MKKKNALGSILHQEKNEYFKNKTFEYSQTTIFDTQSLTLKKSRIISTIQNNKISNAYKILRTRVLQRLQYKGWNTLGVTSVRENDGKTLTAINLAISIAQESRHTALLIDLNFKRPSLGSYFGLKLEHGINDYFLNNIPIENILVNPGIEGLVLLPAAKIIENSSEVLSSEKMMHLVSELKSRYPNRVVVFDLPPMLDSDDVIAFSPYIDAALLVINDGNTKKEDLLQAMNYLSNTSLIGTLLNKSGGRTLLQ